MDKQIVKDCWRKSWPTVLAILFFAIVSLAYFYPATFEGRELFRNDVEGASGTAQDVRDYESATGEHSYWTNSLFGGMPMYQISPSYPSTKALQEIQNVGTLRAPLNIMGNYAWLLFAMMVGFFIFMRSLKQDVIVAVLGALFWTFSSYFVILIVAGHIWKLTALCFIPPTIGGMIWLYRGKYLKGFVVTALFTALQIMANHVQMSYYFLFVMVAIAISFFVQAIRQHQLGAYLKSTIGLVLAGVLGVAINLSNLYHTYEYSKETIRGGSELTIKPEGASESSADANKSGLDKEYITQWSYGIGETWTLLVPNLKGGASGYVGMSPELMEKVSDITSDPQSQQILAGMNQYWGDQPFTAGPVYVGAFVLALFIFGCIRVKGPVKWALLAATILSVLLSWGHNFMSLTSWFIDYFPMYNKFRTVSSILVIAEFTIPALAVLGLVEFMKHPKESLKDVRSWGVALGLTFGAGILFYILPTVFFNFVSTQEQEMFNQAMSGNGQLISMIVNDLTALRVSVFRADVLRSLVVILLSIVPLYLYSINKLKPLWAVVLVGAISLIDLYTVDKRYLNDEKFEEPLSVSSKAAPQTEADKLILKDKTPGYRVFNMTVDAFNESTTSRWHNNIGGYHPAKLQRYQDLISFQLARRNMQVLDMLNTKYFIVPSHDGKSQQVVPNPGAFGPAWFVKDIKVVNNANEEMQALDSTHLRETAVVDKRFVSNELSSLKPMTDTTATISLMKYAPNHLEYKSLSKEPGLAVLSEIYYPHGWTATIDGKPADILRVDYVLRALIVPAGEHTIALDFHPKSVKTTELVAKVAFWILLAVMILSIALPLLRKQDEIKRLDEDNEDHTKEDAK